MPINKGEVPSGMFSTALVMDDDCVNMEIWIESLSCFAVGSSTKSICTIVEKIIYERKTKSMWLFQRKKACEGSARGRSELKQEHWRTVPDTHTSLNYTTLLDVSPFHFLSVCENNHGRLEQSTHTENISCPLNMTSNFPLIFSL